MSPMPPPGMPPGIPPAPSFSGLSATTASVVRNSAAIEAAFWSADRVTLAASMTPAFTRSSYSLVEALRPCEPLRLRTFSTITPPSRPAYRDLLQRLFERTGDDLGTGRNVTLECCRELEH